MEMSFQAILRVVPSRALVRATNRRLIVVRRRQVNTFYTSNRYRWVSTMSTESIDHLNRNENDGDDGDDEEVEPNLEERDRLLEEIRGSLRFNVERILNEKPQVRKQWKKMINRRKRDRQQHQTGPSLLDVLRQPIEDDAADALPDTESTEPSVSEPSDLLGMLDDESSHDTIGEDQSFDDGQIDNASVAESSDDAQASPETTATAAIEPLDTQSTTSLLDLLGDDDDGESPGGSSAPPLADALQALNERRGSLDGPHDTSFREDAVAGMTMEYTEEPMTLELAVDEGLSLLLALKGRDWSPVQDVDERKHDEDSSPAESVEEEAIIEEEVVVESADADVGDDEMSSHDEQDEQDDDSLLETVEAVLEEAASGEFVLSTIDYNALLLSIATSSVQTDEAISLMIKTYGQMSELGRAGASCSPDATTFTILIVTLDRRANAPLSAVDMCRQMIDSGIPLSPVVLHQGLSCLVRRNQMDETKRLVDSVLDDESNQLDVPHWAWTRLLRMYKNENLQGDALDLIDKCIESQRYARSVGNSIIEAISWPRKDRGGHRIDRSSFLEKLLDKLESLSNKKERAKRVLYSDEKSRGASYEPSYHAWKSLILALASETDNITNSGWDRVCRAFNLMNAFLGDSWPDNPLLKAGLKAAQITGDAKLAVDLVLLVYDKQMSDRQNFVSASVIPDEITIAGKNSKFPVESEVLLHEPHNEALERPDVKLAPTSRRTRKPVRVPLPAYSSAMRVCVTVGDTDNADRLLDCIRDPQSPVNDSLKKDLYLLALKGCAKTGKSGTAEALLKEMQEAGMNLTEEAYGTVIHSLAVEKKTKEAIELFDSIRSGSYGDGVVPGVSCYNARMLAHVEAHEWDKALECHSQRKQAGIPWTAASFQDVLLASYRLGKKEKAIEVIEEGLASEMIMNYGCCVMSIQILLGDVFNQSRNIEQVRRRLREIGKENRKLKKPSLNLVRSLRAAEVEDKREPNKGMAPKEMAIRRGAAWSVAMRHLLDFTRAAEKREQTASSSKS